MCGSHLSFFFLVNPLLEILTSSSLCCRHLSSFGFITLACYLRWDMCEERNRKKGKAPLGQGEELKKDAVRGEWCYREEMTSLNIFPAIFFSPLISLLLHSALTGGDSETVCTTTLLFIFLLCPSAAHTYSFKIPVRLYACVCTCAPTAASSRVPRCIIYIHQLC